MVNSFWQIMTYLQSERQFSDVQPAPSHKGYEQPYLNPSVCVVYSATCNSGLVGVLLSWPGLHSSFCPFFSLWTGLSGDSFLVVFTADAIGEKYNIFGVIFEIKITQPFYDIFDSYLCPSEFFRSVTKLNYFTINYKHALCTTGAFFKRL